MISSLCTLSVVLASEGNAQCISFDDAAVGAAANDPAVAAAQAAEGEAAASLKDAKSLFRPQLSAFGRTGLGDVGVVDGVFQNQIGLRASQRVIDFGDAKYARAAAREGLAAAKFDTGSERLISTLEASNVFIDILETRARLDATKKRVALFTDRLEAISVALQTGGATISERAEVAAERAEAEAFKTELKARLQASETRLRILTGDERVACVGPQSARLQKAEALALGDIEELVAVAIATNPSIKSLERGIARAAAERSREKRSRLPIIDVVAIAAYSSIGQTGDFELQERFGVDVSLPLYSGEAIVARTDRAGARREIAVARARDARRDLEEDVRITVQRILALKSQAITRGVVVDESARLRDAAEIEFDNGVKTLTDYVLAQQTFEEAVLEKITVDHNLLRELARLAVLCSDGASI